MSQCPSCAYPTDIEWAICRRCGTALPAVLEVERLTMPKSLPRRTFPRPASPHAKKATSAPVPLPPSDNLLPRVSLPAADASSPVDSWVPKVPSGRTVTRSAGIVAAIVSAALGARRLLRHRH